MHRNLMGSAGVLAVSAGITLTFIINLCDWIFDCGCRSWWNGAVDMCNIHNAHPPHCPWCSNGQMFFNAVLASILVPQLLLSFFPRRFPWFVRLGLALACFPVIGWAVGLISGWYFGYWRG